MMFFSLAFVGSHELVILGIAIMVVLFAKRIPLFGRSIGEAIHGFKTSLRDGEQE